MFKPNNTPPSNTTSGPLIYYPYWPSTVTKIVDDSGFVAAYSATFTSVKTPGFKSIKRSKLPWNNFSHSNTIIKWPQNMQYYNGFGGLYIGAAFNKIVFNTSVVGGVTPRDPGPDADINARSKLLSRLKDSSVNLAQAYAERRQTSAMLARSVNRLVQGVHSIRKGDLKHASSLFKVDDRRIAELRRNSDFKNLKEALAYNKKIKSGTFQQGVLATPSNLSNYWLEYSYGWRPLLSDIYGSAELIAKTFNSSSRHRVTAESSSSSTAFNYIRFQAPGTYSTTDIQCIGTFSQTSRKKYVVEFVEDSVALSRLSNTGILDPALLAWELIPYSFVVDWFVPVGTYLENLGATRNLVFSRGSISTKRKNEFAGTFSTKRTNGRNAAYGGDYIETYEAKSRTILAGFPSPALQSPRLPGALQAVSGIALLTQLFKR